MGAILVSDSGLGQIGGPFDRATRPSEHRAAAKRRPVGSGGAGPAGRQLLGVVGHRARPGRDPAGAVGRPRRHRRRDQPAGPRHPAGPGRGRRRRRRRRRARRRRHAQRGGQRPGRFAPPRWPPLPGGSTNVFARTIGLPDDPVEATGVAARCARRRLDPPGRARLGQRALLPVPRRHGLRRRGRAAGRAAVVAQALRQPPAVRVRRGRHRAPPLRPLPTAVRGAPRRRPGRRRRLLRHVLQHHAVHLPRDASASTWRPTPGSTAPLVLVTGPDAALPAGPGPARLGADRALAGARATAGSTTASTCTRRPSAATARSRTRSTATTWARSPRCGSATSPAVLDLVMP